MQGPLHALLSESRMDIQTLMEGHGVSSAQAPHAQTADTVQDRQRKERKGRREACGE